MTAKDLKNNYQNVIIILICFGLHIGLSNYLYTFAKNLELVLSMRFISNCFANLLITSPIWVGNALLNDGKSYWQRLGLGSNIKEALVFIGLLTLLLSPFFIYNFSDFLHFLNTKGTVWTLNIFLAEICLRVFFFRNLYNYTSWGILRNTLIYTVIYLAFLIYSSLDNIIEAPSDFLPYYALNYLINFCVIFISSCFYFWLYVEWKHNFWLVFGVRLLISYYIAFVFGDGLLHYITWLFVAVPAVLIIIGTILYKQRKGLPLEVKRFW